MRIAVAIVKKFYPALLILAALIFAFWPGFNRAHYIPKLSLFFLGAAIITFARLWKRETFHLTRAKAGFAGGILVMIIYGVFKGHAAGAGVKDAMLFLAVILYACNWQRTAEHSDEQPEILIPRLGLIACWLLMVWATVISGAETFVTRGMAQLRARDYHAAEKSFKTAVKLDHWNGRAYLGLSYLAALAGQKDKSMRLMSHCDDRTPAARRKMTAIHRRLTGYKQARR